MNRRDAEHAEHAEQRDLAEETNELAFAVIGASIEVHRHLGPGLPERAYERALELELRARGIVSRAQVRIPLVYKGHEIGSYRLDMVVEEQLVLEVKSVEQLGKIHASQLLSYLKAGAFQIGLLINFNVPLLVDGIRRVIWNG